MANSQSLVAFANHFAIELPRMNTQALSPERWQQVKNLFLAAVDLDFAARREYLQSNCKDPDLLTMVENDRQTDRHHPRTSTRFHKADRIDDAAQALVGRRADLIGFSKSSETEEWVQFIRTERRRV